MGFCVSLLPQITSTKSEYGVPQLYQHARATVENLKPRTACYYHRAYLPGSRAQSLLQTQRMPHVFERWGLKYWRSNVQCMILSIWSPTNALGFTSLQQGQDTGDNVKLFSPEERCRQQLLRITSYRCFQKRQVCHQIQLFQFRSPNIALPPRPNTCMLGQNS